MNDILRREKDGVEEGRRPSVSRNDTKCYRLILFAKRM